MEIDFVTVLLIVIGLCIFHVLIVIDVRRHLQRNHPHAFRQILNAHMEKPFLIKYRLRYCNFQFLLISGKLAIDDRLKLTTMLYRLLFGVGFLFVLYLIYIIGLS